MSKLNLHRPLKVLAISLTPFLISSPANATIYKFTVTCDAYSKVVEWKTGTVDPGREALRVTTGSNHAGCSVSNFDPASDAGLPVESHSAEGAFIEALPLVGTILRGLF